MRSLFILPVLPSRSTSHKSYYPIRKLTCKTTTTTVSLATVAATQTKRIACVVQYIGTNFSGWERKPNQLTIQGAIEDALFDFTNVTINIQGASRTDARTHSDGQVFHFDAPGYFEYARAWIKVLNSRLPSEILIVNAKYVDPSFDARRNALWRSYCYTILTSHTPSVFLQNRAWHYYQKPLDVSLMNEAAKLLKCTEPRDFSSFRKVRASASHTMIVIYDISVKRQIENENIIEINVRASWFVYGMMRLLAATLVQVGSGQISIHEFARIVKHGSRDKVKSSAPACGLCLMQVGYPSSLNFLHES